MAHRTTRVTAAEPDEKTAIGSSGSVQPLRVHRTGHPKIPRFNARQVNMCQACAPPQSHAAEVRFRKREPGWGMVSWQGFRARRKPYGGTARRTAGKRPACTEPCEKTAATFDVVERFLERVAALRRSRSFFTYCGYKNLNKATKPNKGGTKWQPCSHT